MTPAEPDRDDRISTEPRGGRQPWVLGEIGVVRTHAVASVLRGRSNLGTHQTWHGAIPVQVAPSSCLGIASGPEAHREVGQRWPSSFGQPGSQGTLTRGLGRNAWAIV
jgi:hypothetical protein